MPAHRIFSPEQEATICTDYLAGSLINQIAVRIGKGFHTVRNILKRNGIQIRPEEKRPGCGRRVLTKETRKVLVDDYLAGKTYSSMTTNAGVSRIAIRNALLKAGVTIDPERRTRHHLLNEFFFSAIDTEAKAYILGFFAADGHCAKTYVRFDLAQVDRKHLQLIADLMGSNAPVIDSEQARENGHGVPVVRQKSRINFCSKRMAADLAKLGYQGNKTKRCLPPAMPDDLLRHFFRGLFDGDGSIYKCAPRDWRLTQYGNEGMVTAFADFVFENTGHKRIARYSTHNHLWSVAYQNQQASKDVSALLYKDANFYLERKHLRYLKLHESI